MLMELIEANANKYKFVWKPTKFHNKLDIKIKDLLNEMGLEKTYTNDLISSYNYNLILKKYCFDNNIDVNNIPNPKAGEITVKDIPLVADCSSCIMSEPMDITKYGVDIRILVADHFSLITFYHL